MTTLLVAVGALIVAVIGRAAVDPQPTVHAEPALVAVWTSEHGVGNREITA